MTKGISIKAAPAKPGATMAAKPPSGAGIAGAVVRIDEGNRKALEAALDTKNSSFNANLFVQALRTVFVFQGDDIHAGAEDGLNDTATLVSIKAFEPNDPVEAMIAAQAVMLHNFAMEAGRQAQLPQQNPDMASKLRKDATNSARAMVDMAEVQNRRRGKGPQTIRVERVVVNDGSQAVVGTVTSGTSRAAQQAVGHGAPSFATGDALPVTADDVRERGSDEGN